MISRMPLLLILFNFFISCTQVSSPNESNRVADSTVIRNEDTLELGGDVKFDSVNDNITQLFPGGDTLIRKKYIDGIKDRPSLSFYVTAGKTLYATVDALTDSPKNLRINQVQNPDSTFDGPFGKKLLYPIKSAGTYKLIFGEDMMAEGNWSGEFEIKAWVK